MSNFHAIVGGVVSIVGGCILGLSILMILFWILCELWVHISNRFRSICKAESLIFEYRRNRDEFLEWLEERREKDS